MSGIRKKLNSQRGASITFALLLFLVCAVVGSAVLVAGTAASGRMSRIAETDRRYYAVNSAARFLVETIESETVTIEETKSIESETVTIGEIESMTSGSPVYRLNGEGYPGGTSPSFPIDAAVQLGYVGGTKITEPKTRSNFTVSFSDLDSEQASAVAVDIKQVLNPDGTMMFEISKGSDAQKYTIRVYFSLDKQETESLDRQEKTETRKTTLNWKLSDIETAFNEPTGTTNVAGGTTP